MNNKNYFEIIVGTFVLICAVFFVTSSFKGSNISGDNGYNVIAKFSNIDGVGVGSDVKIAGVKVGFVDKKSLDPTTYQARLDLSINQEIEIPLDSSIKVASEGLLGSKFLQISPGGDLEVLEHNGEIEFTQSSISFEDLLGKFIFSSNDKEKK